MDTVSGTLAPLTALPLGPLGSGFLLEGPFTPAMAAAGGLGRTALERLHREGRVRRLLRGVYVDATVPLSESVRAQALALLVRDRQVVVGATAAWLYGVELPRTDPQAPMPVEVQGRPRAGRVGRPVRCIARDLQTVHGVVCTTPLRTALDLGRELAPDRALPALDGLLRVGGFSHAALLAELPRFAGQPGVGQLRELAALCDGRARDAAESVLRLRWLHGRLPTPTPGLPVPGHGGHRLALGLEGHRFGAVLAGRLPGAVLTALSAHGWRVVELGADRVLRADAALVTAHLEREFHLHLLDQVG
ncbi:MAG TPA: type IV toxin-antitoxin system AbiEi family antitoxin domain-containing protein [Marmoricola sp.]|nr:type IV toxin-antitoxin system AbiEi family antitoxin domain-containing protein [Marmoricola sp.]